MPYVEVKNVRKRFGAIDAVSDTSFQVERGHALCLFGPSGSGKTTLLRIVAGLETPDGGEVILNNQTVSTPNRIQPPNTRDIGMVFQDRGLWPHMRAERHLDFVLKRANPSRAERRDRVQELLHTCRLTHRQRAYPHELSGGEQQRLAIARALATQPALLLLDEPLNNLDVDLRDHFLAIFTSELQRGAALIIATHLKDEAQALNAHMLAIPVF